MVRAMASPTSTTLGYALLGLLHQEPRSGYDLRKIFETTPMAHCSSSPGAIYPALRRLDEQGLIRGRVDREQSLRPRQIFRPTAAGKAALRTWLASSVQRDDVIWHVDELMLRFAFHSFLDSNAATHEFLDGFRRELDGYVVELQGQLKMMPPDVPIHGRLALEAGIESYKAHARWARKALTHFEE